MINDTAVVLMNVLLNLKSLVSATIYVKLGSQRLEIDMSNDAQNVLCYA